MSASVLRAVPPGPTSGRIGLAGCALDNRLMSAKRMNREQFFRAVSALDEDRLRKALWNLYWRGTANVRERIEVELASDGHGRPPVPRRRTPIQRWFGTTSTTSYRWRDRARTWAGTGGCRRASARAGVSPSSGLRRKPRMRCGDEDSGPAASALEQLIDLACEAHDYDYFRSDDPWQQRASSCPTWRRCCGRRRGNAMGSRRSPKPRRRNWFGGSRATAGPVAAEGAVAAKETSLAVVLARMLRVADTWEGFAEQYVRALDEVCTAAHRRADDVGPSTSEPARWRNGTAFCWKTWWTPTACSIGSPGTPVWAVRSRRFSPHGSRTDAETPTSPAT